MSFCQTFIVLTIQPYVFRLSDAKITQKGHMMTEVVGCHMPRHAGLSVSIDEVIVLGKHQKRFVSLL